MNTYYLRCRQSRYEILLRRGERMGVIEVVDGEVHPIGAGCWDYVGTKVLEDGTILGDPDPFVHVNFRTEHDLREKAMIAAMTDLGISQGMQEIANYFITDAEGNITAPAVPMRVFL